MVNKPHKNFFLKWTGIAILALIIMAAGIISVEFSEPQVEPIRNDTSPPSEARAENVYLLIVDGLRADYLDDMPYLSKLAEENSSGIIEVSEPTYSRPAYARIITGASSPITGINSNFQEYELKIPTLYHLATDAGFKTGTSVYKWIYELVVEAPFPHPVDETIIEETQPIQKGFYYGEYDDAEIYNQGISIMKEYNPQLLILLSMEVDIMGHDYGADSDEYRQAVLLNDEYIKKFVESIPDPDESVVIITSDHGMYDFGHFIQRGGHGGPEEEVVQSPLVFTGKGVTDNNIEGYTQLDLAPTVAGIMGLPFTAYMEGDIITEAFDWGQETMQEKEELLQSTHEPFVKYMYEKQGVEYPADGEASISALSEKVYNNAVTSRAYVVSALIILIIIAALLIFRRSGKSLRAAFKEKKGFIASAIVSTAVYFIVHQLCFHLLFDLSYSYSIISPDLIFLLGMTVPVILAFICFYVSFAMMSTHGPNFESFSRHCNFLALIIIIVIAAAFILQNGGEVFLPNFTYYLIYMFTLFHLVITAIMVMIFGKVLLPRHW